MLRLWRARRAGAFTEVGEAAHVLLAADQQEWSNTELKRLLANFVDAYSPTEASTRTSLGQNLRADSGVRHHFAGEVDRLAAPTSVLQLHNYLYVN